jgi:hypothetical protein
VTTTVQDHAHAFDFWLGEWDVHDQDGRHVGHNSITPLFGTGALAEHWRGDGGVEGHSLNSWDPERGCWHQTWLDSGGGILLLDGGIEDEAMVLVGIDADARQRITWTVQTWPELGEGVRQLWETSKDDGETWTVAFDGRYTRVQI